MAAIQEDDLRENLAVDEPDMHREEKVPCICSKRWILGYLSVMGLTLSFAMRNNLSVAIICMVKQDEVNVTRHSNVSYDGMSNGTGTAGYHDQINGTHNITLQINSISTGETCPESDTFGSAAGDVQLIKGEFEWNKTIRSTMLSIYFYGYIITMIPAGILANRFGGKLMWEIGILSSGMCTLLSPVGARLHPYVLCALRFLLGMGAGFCAPASHTMWGKWAPPLERSKLVALTFCGPALGTILTFSISGFLCAYGFDNGWGSIFYVIGIASLIWTVSWWYFTAESPQQHKHISETELKYIEKTIGYKTNKKTKSTPWLKISKSSAVWGCGVAHICFVWTVVTFGTSLPSFMQEVLKFDIRQNGLLSSLPYITSFVGGILSGYCADYVRSREILNTGNTRKTLQTVAFVGSSACFCAMGFLDCHQRNIVVVLLCLSSFFHGMSRSGFQVNYVDFAPRYAGLLFAFGNTAGCIPGTFAPILVGILTPNKSQEEWRNVFFVCAGSSMFGAIFFILFASGEVQDWAKEEPGESEIVVFVGENDNNGIEKPNEDLTDGRESQPHIKLVTRNSLD